MSSSVSVRSAEAGSVMNFSANPGREHFLSLDGIRGLAILAVLCTHGCYFIQNKTAHRVLEMGWTGVDLFFVLSGFLITGILIDTRLAVNRAEAFYARRVLRIETPEFP